MNSYENQQKLLKIIVTSKKAGPAVKDISNWAERAYKDILFPSQQKGSVRQKKPLEIVMDKINKSEPLTIGDYRIAKEYARKEAIKVLKDSNEYKEANASDREDMLKHEMSNILNNMGAFVNPPASASKERKEDQKTLPAGGYVYDPAGGLRKK